MAARPPQTMNFHQLDLNLMRVLTVLYRTRSVTLGSRELSLSQPATSHALARLRAALQDDLFVRTPAGLVPTRLCDRIAPAVQRQLAGLEQVLQGQADFDPTRQAVDWRISLSDLGEMMFLPRLVARLREQAPQSTIINVSVTADGVPGALESRAIDLAIGILHTRHKAIRMHPLFQENYVALAATGRFQGRGKRLSLEQFRQAQLVIASPSATFHAGVDKVLRDLHIASRVTVRSKHFGALPQLVQDTDLLAVVPRMYAESVVRHHPLRLWELPVAALGYTVNMLWHSSTEEDPGQAWLRQQVRDLFERP